MKDIQRSNLHSKDLSLNLVFNLDSYLFFIVFSCKVRLMLRCGPRGFNIELKKSAMDNDRPTWKC